MTRMTRPGFHPCLALAGLLAALALLLPPAHAADPAPAPAEPQKVVSVEGITEYHLDNGLRLLLFPDPSSAKVTVVSTVLVGSRMEGYGETGMAHLLEHMLFKGTPKHPNIPKDLRDRGAQFNATTSFDRTNFFETLNASEDNLDFALNLESDRLIHSYVKREDLLTEMTVVRNEFERGENTPSYILNQRLMSAAYQWHNYSKATIGNRSDIERVPIESLQAFYHEWYQPDNVVLIVAGNFDPQKALGLVEQYYGPIPRPRRVLPTTYTEEPPQDGEHFVVLRRVGSVGMAGLVYHIPAAAHPDFAPLEVLGAMLDAEPSGALYKALVETKKASSVSSYAYPLHDPGVFEVEAQVDKSSTPEAVRDGLIDVMEKLGEAKTSDGEVERAKTKLARMFELEMANSNGLARVLSEWQARGDWRLFFVDRDEVTNVTAADVTRVAQKYFVRSNRTAGVYLPTDHPERADIPHDAGRGEAGKGAQGRRGRGVGRVLRPVGGEHSEADDVRCVGHGRQDGGVAEEDARRTGHVRADASLRQRRFTQGADQRHAVPRHDADARHEEAHAPGNRGHAGQTKSQTERERQRRPGDVQHRMRARVGPSGTEAAGRDAARAVVPGRRVRRTQAAGARLPGAGPHRPAGAGLPDASTQAVALPQGRRSLRSDH